MEKQQSDFDDALVVEQFNAMTRSIPIVFVNLLFMTTVFCWFVYEQTSSRLALWATPPLMAAQAARAFYWRRLGRRGHDFSIEKQRRMLRTVWIMCLALCVGFSVIALLTLSLPDIFIQSTMSILTIACSIAIALQMFTVPRAALSVLWSVTVCTVFVFLRSENSILIAASAALIVVAFAVARLLRDNFDTFRKLVHSRVDVERMRTAAIDLAMTDALTGLPNRRMFEMKLRACAAQGTEFSVAVIDLDGFKPINDLYGHAVGDRFLEEAARRMREARDAGLIARIGGDEFALLIENADGSRASSIARSVMARISAPYELLGVSAKLGASCGVAVWKEPGDENRLVERADMALYEAKARDRGAVVIFAAALEDDAQRRAMIAAGLREAVAADAFELRFQPIVDIATGEPKSFEALARWRHAELGQIPPNVFIPIAEQAGLIEAVTDGLLRKAARTAMRWPEQIALSFNLSAIQLARLGAAQSILSTLAECGLPPRRFEAEVTETAIMSDVVSTTATISALKLSGVQVALDDFGTGYSSFSELCELPLDKVKIDKSFVDKICGDARAASIVGAIVKMCGELDLSCVAEGVERAEQLECLERLGCARAQGYLIARPMTEDETLAFLAERSGAVRKSA